MLLLLRSLLLLSVVPALTARVENASIAVRLLHATLPPLFWRRAWINLLAPTHRALRQSRANAQRRLEPDCRIFEFTDIAE